MLVERGQFKMWGWEIRERRERGETPGPFLASWGPKHSEEAVRHPPPTVPRPGPARKDTEDPQCRIRTGGGSEGEGGRRHCIKFGPREALSWQDLGLGGGEVGERRCRKDVALYAPSGL